MENHVQQDWCNAGQPANAGRRRQEGWWNAQLFSPILCIVLHCSQSLQTYSFTWVLTKIHYSYKCNSKLQSARWFWWFDTAHPHLDLRPMVQQLLPLPAPALHTEKSHRCQWHRPTWGPHTDRSFSFTNLQSPRLIHAENLLRFINLKRVFQNRKVIYRASRINWNRWSASNAVLPTGCLRREQNFWIRQQVNVLPGLLPSPSSSQVLLLNSTVKQPGKAFSTIHTTGVKDSQLKITVLICDPHKELLNTIVVAALLVLTKFSQRFP